MNYIGSKLKLLPFIEEGIKSVVGDDLWGKVFLDLFSGTGIVGRHFKNFGCKVHTNDFQFFNYCLNYYLVGLCDNLPFNGLVDNRVIQGLDNDVLVEGRLEKVLDYLNSLDGYEGFVYSNFSPNENCSRKYFTNSNAKKCDAIRMKIGEWYTNRFITYEEYICLIAILVEAIDKVSNVASLYSEYLKEFKKSSLKDMVLKPIDIIKGEESNYVCHMDDANNLIGRVKCDILYLDPPYCDRQYGREYHVLETIARYDYPEVNGITGTRDYSLVRSNYSLRSKALQTFSELIEKADAKYIFLSYNNEGLISIEDIKSILSKKGEYGFITQEYARFKSDTASDKRKIKEGGVIEYLHYCVVKE